MCSIQQILYWYLLYLSLQQLAAPLDHLSCTVRDQGQTTTGFMHWMAWGRETDEGRGFLSPLSEEVARQYKIWITKLEDSHLTSREEVLGERQQPVRLEAMF